MNHMARWSVATTLLLFGATVDIAKAQNAASPVATPASPSLSAVDYNFAAQANLGAPFQVDSGRLAETKATTAHLRDYAHLMVTSHIPVIDDLNAILKQKGVTAPPNTLLHAAYNTMIATLKAEHGAAFDRDYENGQVDYQKGNAALFQY
jgi:putative membrane protein